MTDNEILNELNNPEFRINITRLIWRSHQFNRLNSEYLKEILKQQLELKELLKGNKEHKIENNLESKFSEIDSKIRAYVNKDLIDDMNYIQE
ncbi:hypothetical protein [Winogradskyella sp. SYSU M77433]|uniref:hypothetical protein n=1 Tax=Winogradskyella sp. SYSU M77433 TaxID=3042722 RepID=UPI0024807779|nr:hypothetical protein [Winogradskyella sp. SYSU M77433]MDH7911137.1 hypothetical protein [Winogradskyella sp. SYSU M77433]